MSITGYTCGDLFGQQLLLEEAEMGLMQILNNTRQLDIISIVGMPVVVNSTVINAAVVIQKGKVLGVAAKTYLPNYKEFYEQRWFTSALQLTTNNVRLCGQIVPIGANLLFETSDTTFGIEICEDLWSTIPPSSSLALQGAEILFNMSADNEGIGKNNYLCSLISQQSAPCSANEELGGIVDQRSSHISMPKVVSEVSKSRLEPIGTICPQRRTLFVVN